MAADPPGPERQVVREADGSRSESPSRNKRRQPRPLRFTIAATGDVLVHSSVAERGAAYASGPAPFDFRPMFRPVRPLLRGADLAICHLETPLSIDDTDLSSYPAFNAPREVADALAFAGYDGCSTASNHALDQGTDGVKETLRVLDDAGIEHAGTARRAREADRITTLRVGRTRIAHLSYTYGFNGFSVPFGREWLSNRIHARTIVGDARRARREGADLVLVSLHWGTEYLHDPTAYQRDVARRLGASGAVDVVLGHHAHVVQPIRRVRGTWVVYGMGNFLSGMEDEGTRDGVIVLAHVVAGQRGTRISRVRYTPTWVEPGTFRILPIADALEDPSTSEALRPVLEESWRRTVGVIGRGNRLRPTERPHPG